MSYEDKKRILHFENIEKDIVNLKQSFNEMIENIIYDDIEHELSPVDLSRINTYRYAIQKCYVILALCNEGCLNEYESI